jgi:naphthoate synthase
VNDNPFHPSAWYPVSDKQLFAGEATRLAYITDEAVEGRDAVLQKRAPDWTPFSRYF